MSKFEPDEQRPNVVIDGKVAKHHEYAGMDFSINLKQMRLWTGFDLIAHTDAAEFLGDVVHMLSYAAPKLKLKEEEGSDWTDPDLQWGEQFDEGKNDD